MHLDCENKASIKIIFRLSKSSIKKYISLAFKYQIEVGSVRILYR
jgi:hypothetical protein